MVCNVTKIQSEAETNPPIKKGCNICSLFLWLTYRCVKAQDVSGKNLLVLTRLIPSPLCKSRNYSAFSGSVQKYASYLKSTSRRSLLTRHNIDTVGKYNRQISIFCCRCAISDDLLKGWGNWPKLPLDKKITIFCRWLCENIIKKQQVVVCIFLSPLFWPVFFFFWNKLARTLIHIICCFSARTLSRQWK